MYGVTLVFILAALCTVVQGGTLKWIELPALIKEGDTVTLRCEAAVTDPKQYFMRMDRVLRQTGTEDKRFNIAISQILDDDYASLGRYSVSTVEESDTKWYMELTITDVKGYDGGLFRCNAPDAADIYMEYHVSTQLTNVYFSTLDEMGEETRLPAAPTPTVVLEEGVLMGIGCTVQNENSGVEPSGSMGFGSNATEEFEVTSNSMSNTTAVGSVPQGIVNFVQTLKLRHMDRSPSWSWHGQILTCSGKMPSYDTVTASVNMDIRYKPVFRCDDFEFYARVGASVTLSCSVLSNPRGNVTVSWGDADTPQLSTTGETYLDDRYILDVSGGEEDNEQVVTFTIQSVTEDDLKTKLFTFRSANLYGTEGESVQLLEGDKAGAVGASTIVTAHVLLVSILAAISSSCCR